MEDVIYQSVFKLPLIWFDFKDGKDNVENNVGLFIIRFLHVKSWPIWITIE